jgi:hypothetical protein
MRKDLNSRLGIHPGDKVCLIRPNQDTLSQIKENGDKISLIVDRVERACDAILYWVDPLEDIREKMANLQHKIKPEGRIWVIIPRKEAARKKNLTIDWNHMQQEILKTQLVDNKVASINEAEYGTQFVIRREYRVDKKL